MSNELKVAGPIPVRPKIGITGSLGRGNYGDELYVKTYQYWFGIMECQKLQWKREISCAVGLR